MFFWLSTACLMFLIVRVILFFLSKEEHPFSSGQNRVYKSYFSDIADQRERGVFDAATASEADLELSRHILQSSQHASRCDRQPRSRRMKMLIGFAVLLIPVITFGLYHLLGAVGTPSQPFAVLMAKDPATLTPHESMVRLEALFYRHPTNGKLADELAATYLEAGQFQDAVNSYVDALQLNGENGPRLVGYGLALSQDAGGRMTLEAQQAFEKAVHIAPRDVYPRLFVAAAMAQANKSQQAAAYLQDFMEYSTDDAPWRGHVANLIKKYKKKAQDNNG